MIKTYFALVIVLTVLLVFLEIRPSSALKCFQCEPTTCSEAKEYWGQQKCKGKKFCLKEYAKDGSVVKRSCAKQDPGKEGCMNDAGVKKCYCAEELCNGEENG